MCAKILVATQPKGREFKRKGNCKFEILKALDNEECSASLHGSRRFPIRSLCIVRTQFCNVRGGARNSLRSSSALTNEDDFPSQNIRALTPDPTCGRAFFLFFSKPPLSGRIRPHFKATAAASGFADSAIRGRICRRENYRENFMPTGTAILDRVPSRA